MVAIVNYIKNEIKRRKEYIRSAAAENVYNNMRSLRSASWTTTALLVLLLLGAPLLIKGWKPSLQHVLFLPTIAVFSIIVEAYRRISKQYSQRSVSYLCIVYEIIVLSFIVLIDAESDRSASSSFISMLFVIFPVLFVFPFKITYGILGVFEALYIIAVHIWKDTAALQQHETFNAICALVFSVLIEGIFMALRMNGYERRRKYEQLSMRDPLLQEIYNKQSGQERMYKYLQSGTSVSAVLIVMDLDNFKHVNDSYGHYKGDCVLQCTGKVLNSVFREKDIVARFGGDEFMVLICGECSKEELKNKCMRVNQMLKKSVLDDLNINVSCSLGAVVVNGQSVNDFDALFYQADIALYEAKRKGKNSFAIHDYSEEEAETFIRGGGGAALN